MPKVSYKDKANWFGKIMAFVAALAIIIICVFGGLLITVTRAQEWTGHSSIAQHGIESAQKAYSIADYKGRSFILIGGQTEEEAKRKRAEIADNRTQALSAVDDMKSKLSDNPEQVKNSSDLRNLINQSFNLQDAQIDSVQKTGNRISYDAETVNRRVEITGAIENAFHTLKIKEHYILEFERLPNIAFLQLILGGFGLAVFIFLAIGLIVMIAIHRDLLADIGEYAEMRDENERLKRENQANAEKRVDFIEWMESPFRNVKNETTPT